MKRNFSRSKRVGDLIQKTLAQMILQDMADARFRLVTVTGVDVSRDLSYAKVYVSVLSDDNELIKEMIAALNSAAKTLRYNLAQKVDLRIAPELKFVYDETTARGFQLSSLIDAAVSKIKK